jgi:hypothetical protein
MFVLPALLLGCLGSPTEQQTAEDPGAEDVKILFIGNSLTFFFDVPGQLRALAEQAGLDVFIDQSTVGGAKLAYHAAYRPTIDKIYERPWDYVVLQGSDYAIAFPETHGEILPAITALTGMIRENDANTQIVFFMDWAMRDGVIAGDTVYTYTEFQPMIIDGALIVANSLEFVVAPIGFAWSTVVNERPDIDLFYYDGAHPSEKGSYLQACVYFSTLFLQSTERNPFHYSLSDDEAQYVQRVASETVLQNLAMWNISP